MNRRELLSGAAVTAAAAAAPRFAFAQSERVTVTFWHAMSGPLGEEVGRICERFNASQPRFSVEAVYKGSYPETMTAAIAAFRAGQAPHVVQVFEVGTGSMLGAGAAVKQAWQLAEETGLRLDPSIYMGAVRGYYSLADGRMASMPFNSSTPVMWLNRDILEAAGLDPATPPATWQDVVAYADAVKSKGAAEIAVTTAWPTWVHLECYGAIHDLPYATKANGFEGLDAELVFNTAPYVKHVQRLIDMAKAGTFVYGGRGNSGEKAFPAGGTAISFTSSAGRAAIKRDAKFDFAAAMLPWDPEVRTEPNNSIIGGASLWTMTAPSRKPEEYLAVASFFAFLADPANDAHWHQATGYVPVTYGGAGLSVAQGYYEANPGTDIAIRQLNRGTVTANSKGLRLGRLVEIRTIVEEELELALQGRQDAKAALDKAVERGNKVLREFQQSMGG